MDEIPKYSVKDLWRRLKRKKKEFPKRYPFHSNTHTQHHKDAAPRGCTFVLLLYYYAFCNDITFFDEGLFMLKENLLLINIMFYVVCMNTPSNPVYWEGNSHAQQQQTQQCVFLRIYRNFPGIFLRMHHCISIQRDTNNNNETTEKLETKNLRTLAYNCRHYSPILTRWPIAQFDTKKTTLLLLLQFFFWGKIDGEKHFLSFDSSLEKLRKKTAYYAQYLCSFQKIH